MAQYYYKLRVKTNFYIEKLWPQAYSQWLTNPETLEFPNGEKFTDTANRVITWFSNVLAMEGVYAVVTHTNIIQIILAYIKKTGLNSIWSYTSQPTGVTLVESHSPARIIYHNDTSHLDGLKSDLSTHAL
jgi:broad specificity phosphatase PhoE